MIRNAIKIFRITSFKLDETWVENR